MADAGTEAISDGRSAYERWMEAEGVPVVRAYYVPDLDEVELGWWEREGANAAFLNLIGTEETNGACVIEIPARSQTRAQRHMFEELIYVVSGRGSTSVWQGDEGRQTFEWHEGAVFAVPLNAWHQHFNGQGSQPARLFSVTSAPIVMNLFHNEGFVFDNPFVFSDRFSPERTDFFSADGKAFRGRIWESNFIPDVRALPLFDFQARGANSRQRRLELADGSMAGHLYEFAVGTYTKAHRHGPGAHIVITSGIGYSLMWPEGSPFERYDWKPGSVVVPPNMWFHQHFNSGPTPATYVALRWNSRKHKVFKRSEHNKDIKQGGDQIEYADEDPRIRELYIAECARHGAEVRMEQFWRS